MRPRNPIFVGVLTGLLVTAFHHTALATNFTNGDLITHGQGEWGDDPNGTVAELLLANYDTVYAPAFGVFEVGMGTGGFFIDFSGSSYLVAYLPANGAAGTLTSSLINPTTSASGTFGGEVAVLKLNIDFSDAGLLPGNLNVHFGDLVLQNFGRTKSGPSGLNGLTVRQFSVFANTALGGGSFNQYGFYTIADINTIAVDLNGSFFDGAVLAFTTNNLAIPSIPLVMQTPGRSGNSITLTCSTTPASIYQFQFTTNLAQTNWISLGSPIRATNYTTTLSDTITNAPKFYRVQLLQ